MAALLAPQAAEARRHHSTAAAAPVNWANVSLTDPEKDAAEIMDGVSGRVLYARNAMEERHPASLTKMMTLYMLFDAFKRGQANLQSMIPTSEHAASQGRTKLYLRPGETISAENAIKAIVVISANDVAVAIAEFLGGTEDHFGEMMTARARQLGMTDTFYHNASGLPDERQITTAHDLAILARHLAYDYPQYFHFFSTMSFAYHGRLYVTHDNLLGHYDGADGIKTGYTQASGFNLASSITRNGTQLIGIVMGGRTAHMRDREMVRLLDNTYAQIAANPRLVAHANIPWEAVAENNVTQPVTAGFTVANNTSSSDPNDEDAAESRTDPGDALGNLIASTAAPSPNIGQLPKPMAAVPQPAAPQLRTAANEPPPPVRLAPPNIRPTPAPRALMVASLEPRLPPPNIRPTPRAAEIGEGDIGDGGRPITLRNPATMIAKSASMPVAGARSWAIQIGAFADMASARGQLAAYAERSMDVLGQSERVVIPFQSVDGKTLYRARFGPFVEAEARAVCQRMTERGQTCFAAQAR
ncbi:MAG TPA: serine hydrolase [Rhizomicrobium sp.]|nr:serine hydrolase [Rhizomicrobium sp.]